VGEQDDRWIIGVDIGGTNLVVGAVAVDGGGMQALRHIPTLPEQGGEAVVARTVELARGVIEQVSSRNPDADIVGVGIGSPGPLDRRTGVVLKTPNLGWENFPVRDLVADGLGLPATLDNDANCATYGEWWLGAGRGASNLLGVTIGTGIGGGVVVDGKIFHGTSDAAGEFGHMTIDFHGRRCRCGNYGCLEAYASGPNIAARAVEGIEAGMETSLPVAVGGDLSKITAQSVYEGAVAGDDFALDVLVETAKILGAGIANLVNAFNPERVVIAGGVVQAGDLLMDPLRATVRQRAFRSVVEACEIRVAELGRSAGVVGAAAVFKSERLGP